MFVPKRTPAAHQVAASQDKTFKGCNVFVESGCDCRFWKTYLNRENTKLRACDGWSKVLESVKMTTDKNELCIGIIDRDFRDYVNNYGDLPDNVFVSDQHDVEMMIVKAEGIERVINNYDAEEHIAKFENQEGNVLSFVLNITDRIGILKMIDRRDKLNFKLRKRGKQTEFDLPNYEKFLDKAGHFVSDEKMIDYLIAWSKDNKHSPIKSRDEILALYQQENLGDFDSYQLSSGHDVTYMIAYLIKRQISKEQTDKEEIEKLLRSSYTHASFEQTELFGRLAEWCVENDMMILK